MGSGFKTPSLSTFGQIRGPIVDAQGNVTPVFQRYLSMLEAKTNQTLSIAGNTVLNNIEQPVPTTVSPTVSFGNSVVPEMTITVITKGNPVLTLFHCAARVTSPGGGTINAFLSLDGVVQVPSNSFYSSALNQLGNIAMTYLTQPLPGSHLYEIVWTTNAPGVTGQSDGTGRAFQLIELG